MWNPYQELPSTTRLGIGIAAAVGVLLVWSVLAWSGQIGSNKLPAPWEIMAAFGRPAGHAIG